MEHLLLQFRKLNLLKGKVISKKSQEESTHVLYDVVDRIPFIDFLGVKFDLFEDKITARLPFKPELIGNGFIKALHGGAIGSFLETVAIVELAHYLNKSKKIPQKMGKIKLPKTIDFTIDYMYPGLDRDSFALAKVNRAGKRYASVSVKAWQESKEKPFAQAIGHFLVPKIDIKSWENETR